jgi:hypothetical protein
LTLKDGIELAWTAPKNIPPGSLTQRLMTFYYLSELYGDYNYSYEMQYYTANITPMQLQKRLRKSDIELPIDFFSHLSETIKMLDNPVGKEHEIDLYLRTFMLQNPSQKEQDKFKLIIEEMQQEIKDRQVSLHNEHQEFSLDNYQGLKS